MKSIAKMGTHFLIPILTFLCSVNATASIESSEVSLTQFLSENELPAETIQLIIEQEYGNQSLPIVQALSPESALNLSGVDPDALDAQFARITKTRKTMGIGAILAAAGVMAMLLPLPGAAGLGVVLIKNGLAVAATATAIGASGLSAYAQIYEIRDLNEISAMIRISLNSKIKSSFLEKEFGLIEKVKLSASEGISYIEFSSGLALRPKPVLIQISSEERYKETFFVSYTPWGKELDPVRWLTRDLFENQIIDLVTLSSMNLEDYLLTRTLALKGKNRDKVENRKYLILLRNRVLKGYTSRGPGPLPAQVQAVFAKVDASLIHYNLTMEAIEALESAISELSVIRTDSEN